jgi:acetyl esterase/lipase
VKFFIIIFTLFLFIVENVAQKSLVDNMANIDYKHNIPPSFESKLIQTFMDMFGMKKKVEKKMITNGFVKEPKKLSKSFLKNYDVVVSKQKGRKVWTISPIAKKSDVLILYLHGGAYIANITMQQWDLIEVLIRKTNATIIVPDYPLAPEANCIEVYDFISILYTRLMNDYPTKRIIFIGDSAGGGLAFGFVQQLRTENIKQPDQIILFSPWLDVSMSNDNIEMIDKEDKMISIKGLKNAGQKYAGNLDLKDYRVSPIYGDLTGLCRISIFTGTKDILNADAQKCKQLMKEQQLSFNYFEYPNMFHDWVIFTRLKESCDAINKVNNLVNNYK